MLGEHFPQITSMRVDSQIIGEDAGYLELANAIVIQAAEDYRSVMQRTVYRDDYEKRMADSRIKQIERFFKSAYGDLICRGNAAYIWDNLQAEFG